MIFLLTVVVLTFTGFSMYRPFAAIFSSETLRMPASEVGFLFSIFGLSYGLPSVPLGKLSDRAGRRPILLLGCVFNGIALFAFSFVALPFQAYVLLALAGLGFAMIDPSVSAAIGDVSRVEAMGRSYGILATVIQGSMALGPVLGGLLVGPFGYRFMFLLAGMAFFVAAPLALLMSGRTHGKQVPAFNVEKIGASDLKATAVGLAGIFLTFIFIGSINVFVPLYTKALGLDEIALGAILTALFLVGALVRIPMGLVMDRGRVEIRILFPSLLLTSFLTAMIPFSRSFELLMALSIALGSIIALLNTSALTLIARSSYGSGMGRAMGMTSLSRSLGMTVGAGIVGFVILVSGEHIEGYVLGFLSLSLAGFLGALSLSLILRWWKPKT